jgi:hypothetical protein
MAFNQEQLEKEGIYEAKSPLPSLLADLEQIDKMADVAALKKKSIAKQGGWLMLGGLLGAIVAGVTGLAFLVVLLVLVILAGFGWWIYSFFSGGKLVQHPVRVAIAKERLNMIRQDAGAKTPFAFRLALASTPTKLRDEHLAHRKNGKQEFFEEPWFSLEGPLLDGTYLSDQVKDLTRKRSFSNANGKRKTKTRTTHLVDVRFAYPQNLYGDARGAGKALDGEVKVAPSAALRCVRVTERVIVMKAMVNADREITQTMGMLSVGGYRILNLARKALVQKGNAK